MNAEECNGRSYMSGSGDSSTEREFFAGLRVPTVSTPNSQQSSPSHSLSANSIKVELYSDEEAGGAPLAERRVGEKDEGWKNKKRDMAEDGGVEMVGGTRGQTGSGCGDMASPEPASPGPIRLPNGKLKCDICGMICIGPNVLMVHKRSHTGERPFQCNQCGASFTQKGNLLRHIKLHSGEKPFKCPFCNYACRRRDALTGHLRTHSVSSPTVGKHYKCSYCGRSYKQQSTLEEHRERCHSYLQSLDHQPAHNTQSAHGEEVHNVEMMSEPLIQSSSEKMTFIDRLANSITKRKRSTPQKFLGEKHMRLNISEAPYELDPNPDKEGDLLVLHTESDPSALGHFLRGPRGGSNDVDPPRSLRMPPHSACLSEFTPVISSVYPHITPLGQRLNCAGASMGLAGREAGEGHEDTPSSRSRAASPSNGYQDSTDTESMAEEQCVIASVPPGNLNHRGGREQHSPSHAKEMDMDGDREKGVLGGLPGLPAKVSPCSPPAREAMQVVDGEGRPVRSFRCEHCRIFFLDHVMFTIHMGCHGFHQPFECNICGHRSQDRYEFSSHIVRGEHQVG
ncbi:LOW QUALITY PROTEIN: zinc finger protein Eos-like [Xyrauchen texanus]|uniref:LOW QUALITY PROTEIN: zinc finger protein Eos-like n=1 Tax=Xyrauchen texanus TaxID=154827 RepID=UPI002241B17C|nr:LOW QUALITY PROTEIN: zinc finger protein Eos-like [Xyrauchen texanus]